MPIENQYTGIHDVAIHVAVIFKFEKNVGGSLELEN